MPDKNGGHHHIIVDNIDDKHVSIGITQKEYKGKNHKNKPLKYDPLDSGKKSYAKRQGTVKPKKNYYFPMVGKVDKDDYIVLKRYGDKAKLKYENSKKK